MASHCHSIQRITGTLSTALDTGFRYYNFHKASVLVVQTCFAQVSECVSKLTVCGSKLEHIFLETQTFLERYVITTKCKSTRVV